MVEIQVPESHPHLVRALRELWARCPAPVGGDVDLTLVIGDGVEVASDAEILEGLTQSVTVEAIEANAGRMVMLHACGLAATDGRVVALVGPSGVGKTTLARTLGRSWAYVTDETVAVADDRAVVAYPKPLSIVDAHGPKRQVSPDQLDLVCLPSGSLELVATVFLERVTGLTKAEVAMVPTVEAIALAAPHTSYLADVPAPLRRLATLFEGRVSTVRYSEAAQLSGYLTDLLGPPVVEPES